MYEWYELKPKKMRDLVVKVAEEYQSRLRDYYQWMEKFFSGYGYKGKMRCNDLTGVICSVALDIDVAEKHLDLKYIERDDGFDYYWPKNTTKINRKFLKDHKEESKKIMNPWGEVLKRLGIDNGRLVNSKSGLSIHYPSPTIIFEGKKVLFRIVSPDTDNKNLVHIEEWKALKLISEHNKKIDESEENVSSAPLA